MAKHFFADDLGGEKPDAREAQFDLLLRLFFARLPANELPKSATKAAGASSGSRPQTD
jgi:hypothetical protein